MWLFPYFFSWVGITFILFCYFFSALVSCQVRWASSMANSYQFTLRESLPLFSTKSLQCKLSVPRGSPVHHLNVQTCAPGPWPRQAPKHVCDLSSLNYYLKLSMLRDVPTPKWFIIWICISSPINSFYLSLFWEITTLKVSLMLSTTSADSNSFSTLLSLDHTFLCWVIAGGQGYLLQLIQHF